MKEILNPYTYKQSKPTLGRSSDRALGGDGVPFVE